MNLIALIIALVLMHSSYSNAKITGAPPYKSIDIPSSDVSSHFDMVIDSENTIFVAYVDGVKIFNGNKWQNLEIDENSGIRTLFLDKERVYLGGKEYIGYIDKDHFGEYHFTNITPIDAKFESIWDLIKCNHKVYFKSVYKLFEFNPMSNDVITMEFDSKLGELICHNNQVTLQDRTHGFIELVNNQWQPSEIQIPENPFVLDLALIDENTYFVLSNQDKWQLLKNNEITLLDFEKTLPNLNSYVSIAALTDGKLVLGSNNGLLTFVDTHSQTTESFQLANEWIAKIIVNNNEVVVLTEFEVYFLQWPSPLKIQGQESGLTSDLLQISNWNNNTYVLSSAGVYIEDKEQDIYQYKLFKRLNWTNHEAWGLLPFNENTALFAESYQLISVDKNNNLKPISETIYPRELIQSKTNKNLVYVITEYDLRSFIQNDDGSWQSHIIYNQRPVSMVETSDNEVIVSTIDEGIVKIQLNEHGQQKLTTPLNDQLDLPVNSENILVLTQFSNGEIYAYKSNEIYHLKDNKLIKDSLNGLDEFLKNDSLYNLKQNHLGRIYATSRYNFYFQNEQSQWRSIPLSAYIKGSIHGIYFDNDEVKITSNSTLITFADSRHQETEYAEEFILSVNKIELSSDSTNKLLPLDPTIPIIYDQNFGNLSFTFSLNDIKNHKDILYSHRIVGLTDKWSEFSQSTKVNMSNLTANRYSFEVRAKNNLNQIFTTSPYQIIINPPWYLTKLFIFLWVVLGILSLLLLLHYILKWRERIHEAQKLDLQKIINYQTQELKEANKKLEKMALYDGLTGLSNRLYLDEFFKNILATSFNNMSILMLDMDHFKKYNDKFGHLAGDELLKKLALILTQYFNQDNKTVVARYGGEEFIIIQLDKPLNDVMQRAEKIRRTIEDKSQGISISIGISFSNDTSKIKSIDSIYQLIDSADQLLYQAKNNGRNQICSNINPAE